MSKPPSDIRNAAKFAARIATAAGVESTYLLEDLEDDFAALIAEADPAVQEETGFILSTPTRPRIMSRGEWASANVDSMLVLLVPLLKRIEQKVARPMSGLASLAYRPVLGAQMGAVLGFLSQRVLGQYDVFSEQRDEVWFIGANVVTMERRFGFVPRDFRLWIALHELTHRAQFEGNPWLARYFLDEINGLLEALDLDARSFFRRAVGRLTSSRENGAPWAISLLDSDQKKKFDELQAFMSVIEGHGNFIMDRIAFRTIPSADRMRRTLRGAVPTGIAARVIGKMLGLDMKKRQYEEGQEFFDQLMEKGGRDATAAVFKSHEMLPSLDEVRSPEKWLARAEFR